MSDNNYNQDNNYNPEKAPITTAIEEAKVKKVENEGLNSLKEYLNKKLDEKIDPLYKMIKQGNKRIQKVTEMLNKMFLHQITSSDKYLQNTLEIMYEDLENGNVEKALEKKELLLQKIQGSKYFLKETFSNVSVEIFPKENMDVVIKQQNIYSTLESLIKEIGEDVELVGKQTDVIIGQNNTISRQNNTISRQNNTISRQNNKIGAKANHIIGQLDAITKLVGGVVKTQEAQSKDLDILKEDSKIAKQHKVNELVRSGHRF